jgi:hypothetical protein
MPEELQGPLEIVDQVGCRGGSCPTVYSTSRDTVVIQGYRLNADSVGLDLPAGEDAVEIPISLLRSAATRLAAD